MYLITLFYLSFGILFIWKASQVLEKNAILTAQKYQISPFIIGSTIIALGTSAPELFTTLFAAINEKGTMIVGNIIGSNIANLSLVFGITIFTLGLKRKKIHEKSKNLSINLIFLIISSLMLCLVLIFRPFAFFSSSIYLLSFLTLIIYFWSRLDENENKSSSNKKPVTLSNPLYPLIGSITIICIGSWLIVEAANDILNIFNLGEMFVGYTVIAIGTSLPEIAASISLSIKGRYEAVAGTLIGSNIFNSLLVLSIPGFLNNEQNLSKDWSFIHWQPLLLTLLIITFLFSIYMQILSNKPRTASVFLGILFIGSYFISLMIAYN